MRPPLVVIQCLKGGFLLAHFLFGPCGWTKALGICALTILAGGFYIPSLVAFFHQRFWYERILRNRYAPSYAPRCSIILPCKGVPEDFESNLKAFLNLNYAHFEIIFAVESESDRRMLLSVHQSCRIRRLRSSSRATPPNADKKTLTSSRPLKAQSHPTFMFSPTRTFAPKSSGLKNLFCPFQAQRSRR